MSSLAFRLCMTLLLQTWVSVRSLLAGSLCHSVLLDRISSKLPHTSSCRPILFIHACLLSKGNQHLILSIASPLFYFFSPLLVFASVLFLTSCFPVASREATHPWHGMSGMLFHKRCWGRRSSAQHSNSLLKEI